MGHIHPDANDFCVTAYIVRDGRVLLINHIGLKRWLPIGGHIELEEDTEQALFREIEEECGLKVEVLAERMPISEDGTRALPRPDLHDIHHIKDDHWHLVLGYYCRALDDADPLLAEAEHTEIRWFTPADLDDPAYGIQQSIHYYCLRAIEAVEGREIASYG